MCIDRALLVHMNKGRSLMSLSARLRVKTHLSAATKVCCAVYLEALYDYYGIKRSLDPITFKMAAILELTESSDFVQLEG